ARDRLREALRDADGSVRLLAALALAQHNCKAAVPILVEAIRRPDLESETRRSVLDALERAGATATELSVPAIRAALAAGYFNFQTAFSALNRVSEEAAEAELMRAMASEPPEHRRLALTLTWDLGYANLMGRPPAELIAAALPLLIDPVDAVRQ